MGTDYYLIKSQTSLAAADQIKSSHSNSSVHCSYYGCFQAFKHILISKVGTKEETIEEERKKRCTSTRVLGTHEIVIELFIDHFKNIDLADSIEVRNYIYDLRELRVIADYHNKPISSSCGEDAYKLAQEIITIINGYYYFQ